MGLCQSTNHYFAGSLELVNSKGRRRKRPDILRNILNGRPSLRTSRVRKKLDHSNLTLPWISPSAEGEQCRLLVEGLEQHGWIRLQHLHVKGATTRFSCLKLMEGLQQQHRQLKSLTIRFRHDEGGTLDLLTQLLSCQSDLKMLNLEGSCLCTENSPAFVAMVTREHPSLHTLILTETSLEDELVVSLLKALDDRGNTHPSRLRHLDISACFGPKRLHSISTSALLQHLPHLVSLETLSLGHLDFCRIPQKEIQSWSVTFWLHRIQFLDSMYHRYQILRDVMPELSWPLLGYVPAERLDNDTVMEPYFSNRMRTRNQLLLGGFPVVTEGNPSTNQSASDNGRELTSLLPDWKESWNHQQRYPGRHKGWTQLEREWIECSETFVARHSCHTEGSFKASALFCLVKEQAIRNAFNDFS